MPPPLGSSSALKREAARGAAHALAAPGLRAKLPAGRRQAAAALERGPGCGDLRRNARRARFLFSSALPTARLPGLLAPLLSSSPLAAGSPTPPCFSPTCVSYLLGVAERDVLFSPETQREGKTSTLEGTRVNAQIRPADYGLGQTIELQEPKAVQAARGEYPLFK